MTLVADFNSSVNVPFQRMRQLLLESGGGLQEGVVGATDLKVAQRGAGANMSVDVPAGAAWVQIDTGTRNGLGHVYNDATANVTVTASDATNPRIDQIILRWNDSSIPTGAGNVPTLAVLTGTATAGTTLDSRVGAAALPNDCLRLADILVPAASSSVTTANIRDRRPWARGYFWASRSTGADVALSTTPATPLSPDFTRRVEMNGSTTFLVTLTCSFTEGAAASAINAGICADSGTTPITTFGGFFTSGNASSNAHFGAQWELTSADLAAGSHLLYPAFKMLSGTATLLRATSGGAPRMSIQEIIRPNTDNGNA